MRFTLEFNGDYGEKKKKPTHTNLHLGQTQKWDGVELAGEWKEQHGVDVGPLSHDWTIAKFVQCPPPPPLPIHCLNVTPRV